jgi:hypothetical protein
VGLTESSILLQRRYGNSETGKCNSTRGEKRKAFGYIHGTAGYRISEAVLILEDDIKRVAAKHHLQRLGPEQGEETGDAHDSGDVTQDGEQDVDLEVGDVTSADVRRVSNRRKEVTQKSTAHPRSRKTPSGGTKMAKKILQMSDPFDKHRQRSIPSH